MKAFVSDAPRFPPWTELRRQALAGQGASKRAKPFWLVDMAWLLAVEQVIQEKGQIPGQGISIDKKPQNPVIKSVGFGVGADSETYRTVRSHAPPVFVAALHLALPF